MQLSGSDVSFRDPDGSVRALGHRVLRFLTPSGAAKWAELNQSGLVSALIHEGLLVQTAVCDVRTLPISTSTDGVVLEHARVPFVTYPYEWPFHLLQRAALATLRMMKRLLPEGYVLKDAAPKNFQFIDGEPVLIDIMSIEKQAGSWKAYGQFCETFLYPLLLMAYRGIPFNAILRGDPEGIDAATAFRMLNGRHRLRPAVFVHLTLRYFLDEWLSDTELKERERLHMADPGPKALTALVASLERHILRLQPRLDRDTWADYEQSEHVQAQRSRKSRAVSEGVASLGSAPNLAWDLGANLGEYSELAAKRSKLVVAMDASPITAHLLASRIAGKNKNILPLVVDLSNPSPAQGWRGQEYQTLEQRGQPDLVMALAVIHHIRYTHNVPLAQIISWLASLSKTVMLEFVSHDDPQSRLLCAGRENIYGDYRLDHFEAIVKSQFHIARKVDISETRMLFTLVR